MLLGFLICSGLGEEEYVISQYSEEYNTRYFFCENFNDIHTDTTLYVTDALPKAFVVEIGAFQVGEKAAFVYNDDKELIISNSGGQLKIGNKRIGNIAEGISRISLYIVNGKMVVYLDDEKRKEFAFPLDREKKIGVELSKCKGYTCRYFNCYEPVAFRVADYGKALEDGVAKTKKNVRIVPHNVGESYNLTFPTDITRQSDRSIRFEYRYEDTRKEGANNMKRARSEISGVFSNSPKNKWIIEYDLYVPSETADDEVHFEVISQIHEESKTPTPPSFCLYMKRGRLGCSVKGDSTEISTWKRGKARYAESRTFKYLEKDRWYHVKVYLKEGWQQEDLPLTRVWIDGELLFESNIPNCYKYEPKHEGQYDYLKFGVYKSGWLEAKEVDRKLQTRIYIFDNFVVKY
jgi:hypothetical protein